MSQSCAFQDCKRASRTLCHCCNQDLCRDHFNQHDDLLNSQLNPLTDEINALADRLTAINIDKITNDVRRKLNHWRLDCHQRIDQFYEAKCEELNQYVNGSIDKQRKSVTDVRSKMSGLIEKQETTKNDIDSLTSTIRTLERELNEIEGLCIQVDIRPLMIDDNLIQITKAKSHSFDLSNLSTPYRTINRKYPSSNAIAANDRFLLVHSDGNLCLVGDDLSVVKQTKWEHDTIRDMCWSSVLQSFFIITQDKILVVPENTLSIRQLTQFERENRWARACAHKSLYLSRDNWDSSVFEYSLLPSIQFVKCWRTTDSSQRKQRIDAIVCSRETLALAINDQSLQRKLIELRSLETFSPIWSLPLDTDYNNSAIRCCLLNRDEWLLSDWCTFRLFHVTNNGKEKGTSKLACKPYTVNLFRSSILIILSDEGVQFHRL